MDGTVVGNYRLIRKLGEGGMGSVYLATHTLLGRKAAVKLLRPEYVQNPDLGRRFFNEAKAATAVRHPGIVEVYDFGYHDDGSAFLVMEFLEGENLADRIHRAGTLAAPEAIDITAQIAGVLAAVHGAGIIHRDLKPENTFLVAHPDTGRIQVKVLDFGIAKLAESQGGEIARTHTGDVFGTPLYMAPEQCKGAGKVDHRADFYSLGCMFFEMVCGRPPFVADGAGEVIGQHIFSQPPRPSTLIGGLDSGVEGVILRLLAKEPERRFDSARALRSALGEPRTGAVEIPPGRSGAESAPVVSGAARGPTSHATTLGAAAGTRDGLATQATGRRSKLPAIALTGAAVLAAAIAVAAAHGSDGSRPAHAPTPDAAALGKSSADAAGFVVMAISPGDAGPGEIDADEEVAPPETITIGIESKPTGAVVYQEPRGIRVGKTPHTATFPRAEGELEFVLKKRGYDSATVVLSAADDSTERVVLERTRPAPRPGRRTPEGRPTPPSQAAPEAEKAPADRNLDPLDTGEEKARTLNPFDD